MLEKYLFVFFVAMVPVIELRGAIPIGLGLGLDVLPTYIVAVVGNMVPVPVIYLFARKFLIWGYHKPLIPRPAADWWPPCSSLWASPCPAPAPGPAPWPAPSWI